MIKMVQVLGPKLPFLLNILKESFKVEGHIYDIKKILFCMLCFVKSMYDADDIFYSSLNFLCPAVFLQLHTGPN